MENLQTDIQTQYKHVFHLLLILSICQDPHGFLGTVTIIRGFIGYLWLRRIASNFKSQQKWEHLPCFTSAEIIRKGVRLIDGVIELVWHLGFRPTPAREPQNIELLLSSMKYVLHYEHTGRLAKKICSVSLRVVPFGMSVFRNVIKQFK